MIEIELFLAPKQFLDVDRIDLKIIEILKKNENEQNIICMANLHMNIDTIIYYAKKIYSSKLEYLDDYKPNVKNSS